MVADDRVCGRQSLSERNHYACQKSLSLRDSFVVAGAVVCLSGCVVHCCLSFAKIIHDRPKAMEKRDCGTLMDVKPSKRRFAVANSLSIRPFQSACRFLKPC